MKYICAGVFTVFLLGFGATPVRARAEQAQPTVPVQSHIINLSVLEALVAIEATDLAGVFGFIPEENTAMAMADYLLHNSKALKLFVKKGEKDLKEIQGINEWDKQVFLYLVGIHSSGILPPGAKNIQNRWLDRVAALSLAQSLPLQIMAQRRLTGTK